jgi:hypothetical protein
VFLPTLAGEAGTQAFAWGGMFNPSCLTPFPETLSPDLGFAVPIPILQPTGIASVP